MERVLARFGDLIGKGDAILAASSVKEEKRVIPDGYVRSRGQKTKTTRRITIDHSALIQWSTSARLLLEQVFTRESATFEAFDSAYMARIESPTQLRNMLAVLRSAKDDVEGGYLFDTRKLIHADVFANELDQATHFLSNDFDVAAAVTAGVVLETTIKEICRLAAPLIDLNKPNGKSKSTDTLISGLKNEGLINEAGAKQLRAWMNVRNDAAHGSRKNGEFEDGEIKRMIDGVQAFIAKHMG